MTTLAHLLFLCHRIPYPPDKGDKIRSWNILSHLARQYTVHLGCFVDDAADWNHVEHLQEICRETKFVRLRQPVARARSLSGLLNAEPLTLSFYWDKDLGAWVQRVIRDYELQCCYVYSSAMAQYVMAPANTALRRVMDFVDVDSEKWREYGERKPWPANALYRRESRRLLKYERMIACSFDASLFVSQAEVNLFRALAPDLREKLHVVANGVDSTFFSPERCYDDPYPPGGPILVFTGAMDYWPNVEAVTWFANDVLPLIRRSIPDTRFFMVGMAPSPAVRKLARLPGIIVTGHVPDVRPYLMHAAAAIAPLRLARGVQNKVLEAMAMARPLVATPQALEGLEIEVGIDVLSAEEPHDFAEKVVSVLRSNDVGVLGRSARERIIARYDWSTNFARISEIVDGK